MSDRRFYRRRFLNRPRHHQGAHVIAEIELKQYDKRWWIDADIHLADCFRCIDLDFTIDSRSAERNALRKIALLREILTDFEAELQAAADEMRTRNPR
jgi:hypothetical protein